MSFIILVLYMFTFPDINFNDVTEVYLVKNNKKINFRTPCSKITIKSKCSQWVQLDLPKTKSNIVWLKFIDMDGHKYLTWVDINVDQIKKWQLLYHD
jgi:hypothetical protein